ncbi:hypothetical protein PFISCL1PPCAC_17563 [Pristionchus fissidentatus]|uniref:Transthyretin-like family protein n=1 Tax=Pristionchus fissidentatus TaxID=1538716 RepID=A0AAV5W797_9BILA|nr:hypothetical protein PFISCL1PPCAC_17563 [Pristionchus fissidentatus]
MMKPIVFALLVTLFGVAEAKMQNVTVHGIAVCDKHRMPNVLVELWEKDTLDPNDLLDSVHTNKEGEFKLKGGEDEVGSIEPFIRVTHKCKASVKPDKVCSRKTEYIVPKSHINGPIYDMTYMTLDIFNKGEKEDCVKPKL